MPITTMKPEREAGPEQLAVAAGFSLLVAGLLLVGVVLPAEYGLDPLGTGNAFGLTAFSDARSGGPSPAPAIVAGSSGVSPAGAPQPGPYASDAATFSVGPHEGFEYKYRLEKGAGMLYSWTATAPLQFEFHGDPDGAAEDAFQSYDKREGTRQAGALVAGFSGIHGWYWENTGAVPVTITLASSGFYSAATEFRDNKRIGHPIAHSAAP